MIRDKVTRDKLKDQIIRDIWTFFETEEEKLEKKKHKERLIKNRVIRDIMTLFVQEEDYYEPKRVNTFLDNNYIEYENNGDKNENLLLDEYLNKIKTHLRNIIIFNILIHGKFS